MGSQYNRSHRMTPPDNRVCAHCNNPLPVTMFEGNAINCRPCQRNIDIVKGMREREAKRKERR